MRFIKSHPVISGVILVDILAIITGFVVMFLNLSKNAALEILVVPRDAEVVIENKTYENGTYNFYPGKYLVTVKKAGFETKTSEIELNSNQTTRFSAYLADENGGYEYYITNDSDRTLLAQLAKDDDEVQEFLEQYNKTLSIKNVLPINYYEENRQGIALFNLFINGGAYEDCSLNFCLAITDIVGGGYDRALALIREKGYDPNEYEILYEEKTMNYLHENPR